MDDGDGSRGTGDQTPPLFLYSKHTSSRDDVKQAGGAVATLLHTAYVFTASVGICLIWTYRFIHFPVTGDGEFGRRWCWMGLFVAEICFSLYWLITQPVRRQVLHLYPFKHRLLTRYGDKLPGVDIFVCTADPMIEPPALVINTVLSAMSYNYPPEKLSIYLSDDGGSELTFYALLEASLFAKSWLPFCRKFNVEPRSPAAYFAHYSNQPKDDTTFAQELLIIKQLFEEMKNRINLAVELGRVPQEQRSQHKGFGEWTSQIHKQNHQSIIQIVIDGRDMNEVDNEGCRLPKLVYMAREKRPQYPHHFKAGAMNALIRVSSIISNGPIILNVDCDMYPNNPDTVLEVLCFFMDEERGHEISYVQFPQKYNNITKNDLYGNDTLVINKIELAGLGGYGSALYCGTGCFHRREGLCGKKFSEGDSKIREWTNDITPNEQVVERKVDELEEAAKTVADCSYEEGTKWGKEMGLIYGCPAEDIVTGLTIHGRGWKSIYYNPEKAAFLGIAPSTLDQILIQHKRWCEGMFQIFCSKYCPFLYAHGKIKLGAQMGYCIYLLWAPTSLATLCYVVVPPLSLLRGVALFPEITSLWFIPFAYVFIVINAYSITEGIYCGYSLQSWWNLQRMLMIRRTTSYLFAFVDTIVKLLGLSQMSFVITPKVVDDDVLERYEREIMEFGSSSHTFTTIIVALAMLNIFGLLVGISIKGVALENFLAQMIICGLMVLINLPVYKALLIRKDNGSIPSSVTLKSIVLVSLACLLPVGLEQFSWCSLGP